LHRRVCGGASGLKELGGAFAGITVLEDSAACNQDFSACAHDVRYGVVMHAAIHFNAKLQTAGLPDLRERLNFSKARVDEGLATETGIHTHYEDVVNQGKNFVESVDGSRWVDDDAGLASVRGD
jgi:hypothetical protein